MSRLPGFIKDFGCWFRKVRGHEVRETTLVPPPELQFVGEGDFAEIGNEFLKHFIKLAHLQPNENVLDVGCGVGRMAVPLTRYLARPGTYDGFDVVKRGIDWCNANISGRYPNFRFKFVDVRNRAYNPTGTLNPETFRFPYSDASFDFVFLTSVFTHMPSLSMGHYVSEISRVLRSGGRAFITFFLLTSESLKLMSAGSSHLNFAYDLGTCRTANPEIPEAAVAYEEAVLPELFRRHDFTIVEPIHYGAWSGRHEFVTYQDIAVVRKLTAPKE